ncbi:hypothetical protein U1Q18_039451 [Sarracenia purpurea var. burkii]
MTTRSKALRVKKGMSRVEELNRDKDTTTMVKPPSFGLEVGFTQSVEDEVLEGGELGEAGTSPSPLNSEARKTIVSSIGEGSRSPTGKNSTTKLSQVISPVHADEDEGDQEEGDIPTSLLEFRAVAGPLSGEGAELGMVPVEVDLVVEESFEKELLVVKRNLKAVEKALAVGG